MEKIPISLKKANEFVSKFHRHNKPVVGHKLSIGCLSEGKLVGVAIMGRPICRHLDDGLTLEVLRVCCLEGVKNANSFLYSCCVRIAREMGYKRCITYTLKSESGSSLRAIGAVSIDCKKNYGWGSLNRPREEQLVYYDPKQRWELLQLPSGKKEKK